jgi:hypothetical protein
VEYLAGERLQFMEGNDGFAGVVALENRTITGARAIHNPTWIYPSATQTISDDTKLSFMRGGTAEGNSDSPDDWSHLLALDGGTLSSGESRTVRFAVVAAETEDELVDAARAARNVTPKPAGDEAGVAALPAVEVLGLYPNPFNRSVQVSVELREAGPLRVRVFDLLGRLVTTLADETMQAGRHEVRWQPSEGVASGQYWVRIEGRRRTVERAVTLLK